MGDLYKGEILVITEEEAGLLAFAHAAGQIICKQSYLDQRKALLSFWALPGEGFAIFVV